MLLSQFVVSAVLAATSLLAPATPVSNVRGYGQIDEAIYNAAVDHTDSYDALIQTTRGSIDSYWGAQFSHAKKPRKYSAPGVSWLNEAGGTATGCGNLEAIDATNEAAFYCFHDKVMYLDSTFLQFIDADYGKMGVIAVMAHEEGHHIQNLLGIHPATSRQAELQADCIAGSYLHWLSQSPDGAEVNLDVLKAQFNDAGDPAGVPANAKNAHGQGWERAASLEKGWTRGPAACSLPL
jgi:predicted metalloprotease